MIDAEYYRNLDTEMSSIPHKSTRRSPNSKYVDEDELVDQKAINPEQSQNKKYL